MKKIKFSIITPTYNRYESGFLELNIKSVLGQRGDGFEYEHIIIDDGSTDKTKELVSSYSTNDSRIKYIHQDNSGPAKAIQKGIKQATGDFVILLDDDDMLTEDSLKLRSEKIKDNPNAGFIYGLAEWIDEYGLPTAPLFGSKESEFLYERMLISNCINNGTTACRTSVLKDVVWPKWLDRSQDYFLWLEMLRPEREVEYVFINNSLVKYRDHTGSYTFAVNDDEKKKERAVRNRKIKELHGHRVAYLADEAYKWVNEAHAANEYRLSQLKEKNARIDEIQQALDYYAMSRVVRYSVKLRNVARGQVVDRAARLNQKIRKTVAHKLFTRKRQLTYNRTSNELWKSDQPLVSVITPFFNRDDTMPETIRSVLSQTFQDFEYIIVDDGSTASEARAYLSKISHPKIQVIHQKNQGVAAARNTGIKQAKGKYIVCLDSDDIIDPTYLEKSVTTLETNHNVSLVTYDMKMFGVKDEVFRHPDYDPYFLIDDNPILTSAMFRKEVWVSTGGYKSDIGYEDWEFWVNAAEHGYFGVHIPETLFKYRTAEISRYIDDLSNHRQHATYIKNMHPQFKNLVTQHKASQTDVAVIAPESALVNLQQSSQYSPASKKQQVLVVVPWMTFGGAETLIYNYCKEVLSEVDLTFVTGLESPHEWEYKFKELSSRIYHLANLFDDEKLYLEFISNLIATRDISVLHIVHSGYAFSMLEELKRRHPNLKVIVTLFNDRAAYFEQAVQVSKFIDCFTADNHAVANHFQKRITTHSDVRVIPNGVDAQRIYNPSLYDRKEARLDLKLKDGEYAVFFIGRLSEEKNPDVFVEVAKRIIAKHDNVQFFIIGDGNMREEVEDLISATTTDRINYLGYKSVVANYLSAADIFVLPSSIEGFPLSILEAMAMEVVPIASDVGAVSEVIEDGVDGFVVKPGSVEEIIHSIEIIAKDDKKVNNMRKASRQKVLMNYSTEMLGENYKKLYRGEK